MSGAFVFEIIFKTKSNGIPREIVFATIDEKSVINYAMFRDHLSKCVPEPFHLGYIDDEEDEVSIDTEEEFIEFLKFAQQLSSKGLSIKLIVEDRRFKLVSGETPMDEPNFNDEVSAKVAKKMKKQIKEELKKELLLEMQFPNKCNAEQTRDCNDYVENACGDVVMICEKRRKKLLNKQTKIERKDKHDEFKFDKRLEKLEAKKKRLLEKAEQKLQISSLKKPVPDPKVAPWIISAVTTNKSSVLLDSVQAGTTFYHTWHITNDGTVPLNNVILRHYWSSPGLEPRKLSTKCPALAPGKEGIIPMGFKAPDEEVDFVSYWHLFYELNEEWVQFGHFVDLRGHVKTTHESSLEKESDKAETKDPSHILNDTFRLPCQMQLEVQKKLEATLASSVIAAEMAREAANVAYRRALECNCSQSSNGTTAAAVENINKSLEKATESIQKLNINSTFDTDTNLNSNEDTDKGFVLVDVPSCYQDDGSAVSDNSSMDKENKLEVAQLKNNNMTLLPEENKNANKGKQIVEDNNEIDQSNDSKNKECTATIKSEKILMSDNLKHSVEQSDVAGNQKPYASNPPHYQIIDSCSPNVQRVNQYPPRNPPKSCQNCSQGPMVYPSQPIYRSPIIHPTKLNGYPKPSIPGYAISSSTPYVPATSQPLPYTFGQPSIQNPWIDLHPPAKSYQNIPPVGQFYPVNAYNATSVSTMKPPYINPVVNTVVESNSGYNATKDQVSQSCSALAGNQSFIPPFSIAAVTKAGNSTNPDLLNTSVNTGMLPPPLAPSQWRAPVIQYPPVYPVNPLINMQQGHFNTELDKQVDNHLGIINGSEYNANGSAFKSDINTASGSDVRQIPAKKEIVKKLKSFDCVTNNDSHGQTSPVNSKMVLNSPNTAKKESGVQILPQSLVDGAINVASSAYSTAWNALTHLRPKGEAMDFDPVFETNMALLVEMGFNNLERNARLLKRFNNDVNQVIGAICASGGGDLLLD